MIDLIDAEIARRAFAPSTLSVISERLAALGYELDRALDCRGMARIMTGEHAGLSYPCCTTGIKEADTGLSFANADARRDDNFRALQDLRGSEELYAVTRGAILDL